LQGRTRRYLMTDLDAWHWNNVELPAGMRLGEFHFSAHSAESPRVVARFGPTGLEGKVTAGALGGLTDAFIHSPTGVDFGVALQPDGIFSVGAGDLMTRGQFISGAVLTDQQQNRQAVVQKLFSESRFKSQNDRGVLVAWADPIEMPFDLPSEARTLGSALVTIPLSWERTPPATPVRVPGAFVPFQRVLPSGLSRPNMEGQLAIDMYLRFQIPASVLPMKIKEARLFAKVMAPGRNLQVFGHAGGERKVLKAIANPIDPFQLNIIEPDLLTLDDRGGIHLSLVIGDVSQKDDEQPPKWTIEVLNLEIVGDTN